MIGQRKIVDSAAHGGFEFDYNHNTIFFNWTIIHLTPHESDILQVLLGNRSRPTSMEVLIQKVYGMREPNSAAVSIRVAVHSLRKKILVTGIEIRAEPRIGYEINASAVPELNRRLSDKILMALNLAQSSGEKAIAEYLEAALTLAEKSRQKGLQHDRQLAAAGVVRLAA
ncbi:MAG: Transcriptional regulatory protein terminal [Rhodospirillales bacterium]|nr:Transcriptional regulatory protein terminal [Rhodospirillales bacterium]